MTACAVCSVTDGHRVHQAREMMFGTQERFDYLECGGCGTVQLLDPPADMAPHYPPGYYSGGVTQRRLPATVRRRHAARLAVALAAPRPLAQRLGLGTRPMWMHGHARRGSRILDVGSGVGNNLWHLWNAGFRDLTGYDPFFDGSDGAPFVVHRTKPDWFRGHFDVVMMHHAFEHVPDLRAQLRELIELLRPGGRVLLRVPLADSWAWHHYGVDWVQLDPPRHLWLLTERAVELLAEEHGLRVLERWRDSTAFQVWGSELYRHGLPLQGNEATATPEQDTHAARLNAQGDGDQGVFWLGPAQSATGAGSRRLRSTRAGTPAATE